MASPGDGRDAPSRTTPKPTYPIESVDNALKLLHLFRKRSLVRVSEASELLGIARSTAHRLLQMLQYHGFVRQDPVTKAYLAGRGLVDLGLAAVRSLDARRIARPALERLCRELDETVHLAVLDGRSVLYIDSVESTRTLRVGARTGILLPAHATAAGKALLAELSPAEVRALLEGVRLEALTPRTVTRLADLERELEQVREQDYATSFEAAEPGVSAVAVAVRGLGILPQPALTIGAPSSRVTRADVPRIAAALLAATESLARRPPPPDGA